MKIVNYITGMALVAALFSCSRKGDDSTNTDNPSTPQYFKTQSEAVLKGKNDLLNVMRSSAELKLTINPELLQKSQPGIIVKHLEIDFDRLLKQDQPTNLGQLSNNGKSNINTLMVDNNVITVVQTSNSEKGWAVTGLADAALANDIDEVLSAQSNSRIEEITLYEIANLQAFIFQVKTLDGEAYYSKYDGFNLKEGASIDQLYPVLRSDAQLFDRKYGEEIKSKQLVK